MKPPHALLALVLALTAATASATRTSRAPAPEDPLALADRYFAAYAALDFDALDELWTDDVTWQDPTGGEIGARTAPVHGRAALRAHLREATLGIEDLAFDLPERFASGGFVVASGTMSYVLPAARPGGSGDLGSAPLRIPFRVRTVIVLELEDGRVARHTDYADFRAWREQYERGARGG